MFISSNTKRTHLGFDNTKDARRCYEVLGKLDGMNPRCKWRKELEENASNSMDIKSFLYGIYYAGKLPSRAEYKEIADYLRKSGLVSGKQAEIEQQVTQAIADVHLAHEAQLPLVVEEDEADAAEHAAEEACEREAIEAADLE